MSSKGKTKKQGKLTDEEKMENMDYKNEEEGNLSHSI